MNSAKQCMNSAKQCVNSEPMWGYCSRAEKKKKKKEAENVDVKNAVCKRYLYVNLAWGVEGLDPFILGRKVYNYIAIRILGILAALFHFSVHPP